jgi:hypothetical protein
MRLWPARRAPAEPYHPSDAGAMNRVVLLHFFAFCQGSPGFSTVQARRDGSRSKVSRL